MPIGPSNPAPYDTLETVAQLTRTILADYVQNVNAAPQGLCNTNGTAFTWKSGPQLSIYFNGAQIQIAGLPYIIQQVTSATTAILTTAAPIANGVAWVATIATGDIFADSQAYVLPTINLAWRKLQKKLDYASHPRMQNEVDILSIPVAGSSDPATQQFISWTGFNDGVTQFNAPSLPQDFLSPLRVYERQSVPAGVSNTTPFRPMRPANDGLPSIVKGSYNVLWDWREDAIYFIGAIVNLDLRVRYQAFLPDIVVASGGFGATIIPIMRSAEALAYYTAAEFVNPRGGVMGMTWETKGDMATDALTNRQAKLQQRVNTRRRAVYDSSGHYSRGGRY